MSHRPPQVEPPPFKREDNAFWKACFERLSELFAAEKSKNARQQDQTGKEDL